MSLISVADDLRYVIDTVNSGEVQGGYLDRVRMGGYRGNTEILRHLMKILATPVRRQASSNNLIQVVNEGEEGVQMSEEVMHERMKVVSRDRELLNVKK